MPLKIWTEELFDKVSKEIIAKYDYFPPAEFLRKNGYGGYVSYIYKNKYTYEFLNKKYDVEQKPYYTCRNGMRFRSCAEANFANFLFARGIDIKQGERYPDEYSQQTGRKYGQYDIHFMGKIGLYKDKWIACEIWGDNPKGHGKDEYALKRKQKEDFNSTNQYFLGISYKDCYESDKLISILEPYIGNISPYVFNNKNDENIDPTKWNLLEEVIMQCKWIMANNNELPSEEWFRKRGNKATRQTDNWEKKYNLSSLSRYINQVGGIRLIRDLLQTSNKSTNIWDKDKIITLFKDVHTKYQLTPYAVLMKLKKKSDTEKTDDEKQLQNQLSSVIGGSCSKYFQEGGYREACRYANIPCRKAPTKTTKTTNIISILL